MIRYSGWPGHTLATALVLVSMQVLAEPTKSFSLIDSTPPNQTWLNAKFYSYHFQRDKGFNDSNPGLGVEQRLSTVNSHAAGRFETSDRRYSNYAGAHYQPVALGPVRLSAVIGEFNGYPKMRNGERYIAVIPITSIENQSFGVNVAVATKHRIVLRRAGLAAHAKSV